MDHVIIWWVLLEIKHLVADGLLQRPYHLGKFKEKFQDYAPAMLSHACINGIGVWLIIILMTGDYNLALSLMSAEIILHWGIDRLKASKKLLGRWTYTQAMFWHMLMLDQMIHRLTYVMYVCISEGLWG